MPLAAVAWPAPLGLGLLVMGHVHHPPPQVRIDASCPHRFRIVPLGRAARWFREIGLTRPLRSPDRAFDARWSVETDDVEFGEALLRKPEARDAVGALAELGAHWITHDGRRLIAVLGRQERRRIKEPERKAAVAAQLRRLDAPCAELCRTRAWPRHRFHTRLFRGLLLASLVVLMLAVVAFAAWSQELVEGAFGTLALRSLVVGVPLGLVALAAAIVMLAGRSTSHRESALLAFVLLPAAAAAVIVGALAANRFLDEGPAVEHRVPVLALRERREDHRLKGYWAVVPTWHEGEGTQRIAFGTERGGLLSPGRSTLRLLVSPGRLGAERMLSVAIVERPER